MPGASHQLTLTSLRITGKIHKRWVLQALICINFAPSIHPRIADNAKARNTTFLRRSLNFIYQLPYFIWTKALPVLWPFHPTILLMRCSDQLIIQTPQAKLYLFYIMDTQLRTHSNESNMPPEWHRGPWPQSEGSHQQQEPTSWQTNDTIDTAWQNSTDPPIDQNEWCSKSCKFWAKIATTHTWPRFKNWTVAAWTWVHWIDSQ